MTKQWRRIYGDQHGLTGACPHCPDITKTDACDLAAKSEQGSEY